MKALPALLAATLALPVEGLAAPQAEGENEIVVTALNAGAPMWTIETGSGTVILVGEIRAVPEATPWFPERLEAATARSQRVILGTRPKISPGDVLRMILLVGKITRLPKGTRAADYLDSDQRARLQTLEARYDQDYADRSLLITAFDLLARRLGFSRDTGRDASDIVERAARRARVPAEPVGAVRGEDMLDSLSDAPPHAHVPCLEAAMEATEQGTALIERRGADWRASDVPAVMANPIEIAMGRCWPWADHQVGSELRGQWIEAIARATRAPGVTLAVAPLRVLAEDDGVLDQLERRGLAISGPDWR